jgi:hypothetical protein
MTDASLEGTRRRQARLGVALTPAERLRWLEETRIAMLRWRGRARSAEAASRRASEASDAVRDPPPPRR